MGYFSERLMSSASDQKLFCKLSSPFSCSFDGFVEEKVISPSYSSAILTPPGYFLNYPYFTNGKLRHREVGKLVQDDICSSWNLHMLKFTVQVTSTVTQNSEGLISKFLL